MNKVIQLSGSTISTMWAREGESWALRRYGASARRDEREQVVYGLVLAALLFVRIVNHWFSRAHPSPK